MRKLGTLCKNTLSKMHLCKIHFENKSLEAVSHSFQNICEIGTLCYGPKTQTQWKSESVNDQPPCMEGV